MQTNMGRFLLDANLFEMFVVETVNKAGFIIYSATMWTLLSGFEIVEAYHCYESS